MNILFVGYNGDVINWGCRATSKALESLISKNNNIKKYIKRIEISSSNLNITGIYPRKLVNFVKKNNKTLVFKQLYNLMQKTGVKSDYLTEDPLYNFNFFKSNIDRFKYFSELYNSISSVETVIINGEGTFIFSTPSRRDTLFYLLVLDIAEHLNKKTYVLNTMLSDFPGNNRNEKVLRYCIKKFEKCELITTRDQTSLEYLKHYPNSINIKFIPDALFTWYDYFKNRNNYPTIGDSIITFPENINLFGKFNFEKPYIIISGSSSAAWNQEKAIQPYSNLVNKIKEIGIQVYLVPTCGGDNFLNTVSELTDTPIIPVDVPIVMGASILANATLMISGRFHPSILASLGGTPCVFLDSNSHKTLSIQHLLEYDDIKEHNAIPTNEDITEISKEAISKINKGIELRNKIIATVSKRAEEAKEISKLIK